MIVNVENPIEILYLFGFNKKDLIDIFYENNLIEKIIIKSFDKYLYIKYIKCGLNEITIYCEDNKLGPSFINLSTLDYNSDKFYVDAILYYNSRKLLHRLAEPSKILYDRRYGVILEGYYNNGKLHNTVGPAYRFYNLTTKVWKNSYYINNKKLSFDEFHSRLQKVACSRG